MAGYVKLYRKLESWEWYTDIPTKVLFLHCLLRANHKPNKWRGMTIEAGSFVTSYSKLSSETGLSVREVRTSLNRLKSTSEVTHETTSEFSVINVVKWADYQGYDDESDKVIDTPNDNQATSERQANDKRTTTNKNDKNIKNEKNKEKSTRSPIPFGTYGNVKLTQDEYEKLGNDRDIYVQFLDDYIEEKGYKSKNHNLAIQRWVIKAIEERNMKNGKPKRQDILPTHMANDVILSEDEKNRIIAKGKSLHQVEGLTEQERDELFQSLNQLGKK